MKVWRDRSGKKIDFKEFRQRFAAGVEKISPIQQAKTSLMGQFIILSGVVFGLVVNLLAHVWWLFVVLIGSLFVVSVATLGSWQKYKMLKSMEESFESLEDTEEVKGGKNDKVK